METLLQDIRFGVRVLLKRPGFTLVAVAALALGIGANTAIFSVVNGVLLRPLPYADADRLVMVWMNNVRLKLDEDWHSYPNYADYRDQNQTLDGLAAFANRSFNLTGDGEPERVAGAAATSNLFPTLGVEPLLGRAFTAEEDQNGRDGVVVLGAGLWKRRFGGDRDVLGKTVSLNGVPRTVVGVMPPDFKFPTRETELWVPLAPPPQMMEARSAFWLQAVGRLKPGVPLEQARADLGAIAVRIQQADPQSEGYGVNTVLLHDQVVGNIRPALLILMGAVAFVLLIACANVANLLLARAAAREREIAIRMALGAGRLRLARQLLTESLLLFLLGGAAGVLLAAWGLWALVAASPENVPRLDQVGIDGRVLAFTAAIALLTGLVSGLAPALQTSKADLTETLKEGGRSQSGGARAARVRHALVVSEVALSLVLLIGAGLMIRSFVNLLHVDPGFDPDGALTMELQLSGSKYGERAQVAAFYRELLERLPSVPGVQSAGAASAIFLSKTPNSTSVTVEGRPEPLPVERVEVPLDTVTGNFFRVMGTPLLSGRFFDDRDAADATPVVIINETMAKRFWPNEDPLGRRFKYGNAQSEAPMMTIVGVVADMRRTGFDAEVRCETFLSLEQNPTRRMTLVVRTAGDPAGLASALRSEVMRIDRDQPVFNVRTLDELVGEKLQHRRLLVILFGMFAGVALLLAAVGIYGVMSYAVAQRTHEIGIRIALGASKGQIVRLVVGQGLVLALVGIGVGLGGAFVLTRFMEGLLYGVSSADPVTFALLAGALAGVALLASYIPARRATRVDPMIALRYD